MATINVSTDQNINLNQLMLTIFGMMIVAGVSLVLATNILVNSKVNAMAASLRTYQSNPVSVSGPNQTNEAPVNACVAPAAPVSASSRGGSATTAAVDTTLTGYGNFARTVLPHIADYTYSPSNSSVITTNSTDNYTYYDHSFNKTSTMTTSIWDNNNTDNRNSRNGNGVTNTDNRNSHNGNGVTNTNKTSTSTTNVTVKNNGNTNTDNRNSHNGNGVTNVDNHSDNSNQNNATNNGNNSSHNNGNTSSDSHANNSTNTLDLLSGNNVLSGNSNKSNNGNKSANN